MAVLATKIPLFINKAVTKCRLIATALLDEFDPQGYQSDSSADLQLKLYETRQFLRLLNTDDFGGMTTKEISDNIDFFTSWLQLNKVANVNYLSYSMPVQGNMIVVPGAYALQADLASEITARTQGDQSLSNRVQVLEDNYFTPASVFPSGFWDNYNDDYTVVFDDDIRLHTHANKSQLDQITAGMISNLSALQAHYNSINGANSVHVTSAERTSWNARITSSQLTSTLAAYSQTNHTHSIAQIDGLETLILGINQDIVDMAAAPGEDGREVEFNRNGDNLEYRYVGDIAWIDLGEIKGDEGPEFSIDVRGPSNQRFNSVYDNEGTDFSYLETDTGYLYLREPGGGLATVPAGWSAGIKFTGDNGWSPVLGAYEYTASRVVQEIVDWTGGVGTKPVFDAGVSPPNPIRWFIGPNGPTLDPNQAINIKGPMGNGHGPIIGAVGAIAGRTAYDGASIGFIYMRNDVSPQTIYVKQSDASADWSAELPWQGPSGLEGAAANSITNAMLRQSAALSVIGRSANSVGDVADIAGTDGQLLRVSGTTLGFGNNDLNALVFKNNQGIDVVASGGSDVLNIGTSNADVINIGWSGSVVNITGSLSYQDVTNLEVTDKLIRLNKGGAAASAVSSGFELEEDAIVTAYFATNGTRDGWDFKAPAITGVATFSQASMTGARTYTLPDVSGTFVLDSSTSFWSSTTGATLIGNNSVTGAFNIDFRNTNTRFDDSTFQLFNPARTFTYSFSTGAITGSRIITLPTITGSRTLIVGSGFGSNRIPYYSSVSGDLTASSNFTYDGTTLTVPSIAPTGKITANVTATTAGLNVGSYGGDPSAPIPGDIWYDTTGNGKFSFLESGAVTEILGSTKTGGLVRLGGISSANTSYTFAPYNSTQVIDLHFNTGGTAMAGFGSLYFGAVGAKILRMLPTVNDVSVSVGGGDLKIEQSGAANFEIITDHAAGGYIIMDLPVSSVGLPSGALWNNSGVVSIV